MAVSWQRLIDGKDIHEMDIVMLHHELLEHTLMTINGTPYYKAHSIANEKYNYQKYCDDLDRKAGLDGRRLVFGWASVAVRVTGEEIVDQQEDIVEIDELEAAAYEYTAEFGTAGEMHERGGVGRLIESVVFTKEKAAAMGIPPEILPQGWWVGFRVDDPEVWQKVKNGTYSMFSIEGTAKRVLV